MTFAIHRIASIFILLGTLAIAGAAQAGGKGISGVWQVAITPDGAPGPVAINLAHFDQDGTLTNIDGAFGTGLGTWERVEGRSFATTFTHFFNANGAPGVVTVEGSGTFSEDMNSSYGEFTTTISVGGVIVDQFGGTIEGTRQ